MSHILRLFVFLAALTLGLSSSLVTRLDRVTANEPVSADPPPKLVLNQEPESDENTDRIPTIRRDFREGNCGEWTDVSDHRGVIRKWLRGAAIKEVPYCSGTGNKATAFNPSNVHPRLVDLNGDGQYELAIRSICGATGNCDMTIYTKTRYSYRKILVTKDGTQYFEVKKPRHFGFRDIWSFTHFDAISGGMVIYRYDGKTYRPTACFEYHGDKDANGKGSDKPTFTPYQCFHDKE
jgi:hypothetical protein